MQVSAHLSRQDRDEVDDILRVGRSSARVFKRARILQLLDDGATAPTASAAVGANEETARRVARRYASGGLKRALFEAPRPGHVRRLNAVQEAAIIALACSSPPQGFARWSLQLLVKEAVMRDITEPIGRETVRRLLSRHDLQPWREKNVVRH